jgi:hypothetical protein
MPVIYKRFTEKEARDWRQIYKVGLRSPKSCLSTLAEDGYAYLITPLA